MKWRLYSISFDLITYGENKGKYKGRIKFINGDDTFNSDSMEFKIPAERTESYIRMMSDDIVRHGKELGETISASMDEYRDLIKEDKKSFKEENDTNKSL